jgi:hypothetical protein
MIVILKERYRTEESHEILRYAQDDIWCLSIHIPHFQGVILNKFTAGFDDITH